MTFLFLQVTYKLIFGCSFVPRLRIKEVKSTAKEVTLYSLRIGGKGFTSKLKFYEGGVCGGLGVVQGTPEG